MVLYTIGHSNRTIAELVAILRAHGVEQVADIRTVRRSRTFPRFGEAALRRSLTARGIRYIAIPELGGRRGKTKQSRNEAWEHSAFRNYADYALTRAFAAGLRELRAAVRPGAVDRPTAMMCSEAVWWRCHRRIVTDWLLARGDTVIHLMSKTVATPATLAPFAVVRRGRVTYPA